MNFDELLFVLDGVVAGKTHREIAIDLFGEAEVNAEWYYGSKIRAAIRRRIEKAKILIKGGYRDLLKADGSIDAS